MRNLLAAAVVGIGACAFAGSAYSTGTAAVAPAAPLKAELEAAYRLKEEKRTAEALTAFEAIAKKNPRNQAVLAELGYLHAGLKHYKQAASYLAAASRRAPSDMRLRMDLGYIHHALKQPAAAAAQFKAVAAVPGEFQTQAQDALSLAAGKPAPSAIKQRLLREQGYAALNRQDKAGALKAFEAAALNDPKDAVALKQLAFLRLDAGSLAAAAESLEAVRAIEPSDYEAALQLGYTYDRLQKKEQARAAFGAALASSDAKLHDAARSALQSSGGASAPALGSPR
ncbi:MAG: tetratricopeptide repeat protein [Elusimicrobia bacterium]|nr:tetratricopeptide repeat protein [Elusimicrobiota bacterium]